MQFQQYQARIRSVCEALNHRERVAVCLLECIRLAPLYDYFSAVESWGAPSMLRNARDAAVRWLKGGPFNHALLSAQLEAVTPDTEDFGSVSGSCALNAATSHLYLLDLLAENNLDFLLYVLQNCYDTVDFLVQEQLDPDGVLLISEEQIENHSFMLAEVNGQFAAVEDAQDSEDLLGFALKDPTPIAANCWLRE